jgi:hypothetical protein
MNVRSLSHRRMALGQHRDQNVHHFYLQDRPLGDPDVGLCDDITMPTPPLLPLGNFFFAAIALGVEAVC